MFVCLCLQLENVYGFKTNRLPTSRLFQLLHTIQLLSDSLLVADSIHFTSTVSFQLCAREHDKRNGSTAVVYSLEQLLRKPHLLLIISGEFVLELFTKSISCVVLTTTIAATQWIHPHLLQVETVNCVGGLYLTYFPGKSSVYWKSGKSALQWSIVDKWPRIFWPVRWTPVCVSSPRRLVRIESRRHGTPTKMLPCSACSCPWPVQRRKILGFGVHSDWIAYFEIPRRPLQVVKNLALKKLSMPPKLIAAFYGKEQRRQ